MANFKTLAIFLGVLCWWGSSLSQPVLEDYPVLPSATLLREKLIHVAESQLYVRESTGHNDGKEIRKYLALVGLPEGNPYCAAGMSWCHEELSIPNPLSAWSPDWFKANVVYKKYHKRLKPFLSRPGQVFGLYYDHLGRIGHIGLITSETNLHYNTIEFNTGAGGTREGDGVHQGWRKGKRCLIMKPQITIELQEKSQTGTIKTGNQSNRK